MIPKFPVFKEIELRDQADIEAITKAYPGYSDFNFTSMWCWDINGKMRISALNQNLVVKFTDYMTGDFFYSFIGSDNLNDTTSKIIDLLKKESAEPIINLVPEHTAGIIDRRKFRVEESRDHFDYILDNKKLIDYKGRSLRHHASGKRKFLETYGERVNVKNIDLSNSEAQDKLIYLHKIWIKNKISENKVYSEFESIAIERFFAKEKPRGNFIAIGIFYMDELIGFTIDELAEGETAVRHFMKADKNYHGIYSYLASKSSEALISKNKPYVNIEQDLGQKGLRQAKKSFDPINFLKKYSVSYAQNLDF